MKKAKKFDLAAQLESLPSWSASGGVWRKFRGTVGTKTPDCTVEKPCLRSGWFSFSSETKAEYEYVEYQVSDSRAVVVSGLGDPFRARLIAASPDLLRFVKRIADGDATTLSVMDEARRLIKEIREPVSVYGRHDLTTGPVDPADFPDRTAR